MPTKTAAKTRKRLSDAEKKQRAEQRAFTARIRTTFTNAGFTFLPTGGIERQFGKKVGELDQVFLFENIVLICEDTILLKPRDHLKNKAMLFSEIDSNRDEFLTWLRDTFKERLSDADTFDPARYEIFYLYFSKTDVVLTEDDADLFAPTRVVRPATLAYLHKMAQNIKRSARTDIFRFLGLSSSRIGARTRGLPTRRFRPRSFTQMTTPDCATECASCRS